MNVLFDMDGTLIDASKGIFASLKYTLQAMKYEGNIDEVDFVGFIGPPLTFSFKKFFNEDEEKAKECIRIYRQYYYENCQDMVQVYDGITETLTQLKERGHHIYVATSKLGELAKNIVVQYGLETYFDGVFGSTPDGKISEKAEVIRHLLDTCQLVQKKDEVVMIGDTHFDIEGAKEVGIKSIGVLYGFGSREELEEAGADWIVEKPQDILQLVD